MSGFDWVGIGEEHSNPFGMLPNPCLAAAFISAISQRVRIAILGAPVPLLNPLRIAEEYAWIDVVSGGRLEAGLVRGVPQNYAAYNVNPDESWECFVGFLLRMAQACAARAPVQQ